MLVTGTAGKELRSILCHPHQRETLREGSGKGFSQAQENNFFRARAPTNVWRISWQLEQLRGWRGKPSKGQGSDPCKASCRSHAEEVHRAEDRQLQPQMDLEQHLERFQLRQRSIV